MRQLLVIAVTPGGLTNLFTSIGAHSVNILPVLSQKLRFAMFTNWTPLSTSFHLRISVRLGANRCDQQNKVTGRIRGRF